MEQTSISNLNTKSTVDDNDYLVVDDLSSTNKVLAKTILDVCKSELLAKLYPVGSIYMSVNSTSPATLFGGTWEQIKDRFLLGGGSYTLGATGGEKTHTLTVGEMPAHQHVESLGDGSPNQLTNPYRLKNSSGTQSGGVLVASWASTGLNDYVRTNAAGNSQPHNNMPPYLVVNIWKRTA